MEWSLACSYHMSHMSSVQSLGFVEVLKILCKIRPFSSLIIRWLGVMHSESQVMSTLEGPNTPCDSFIFLAMLLCTADARLTLQWAGCPAGVIPSMSLFVGVAKCC